VRYRLLLNPAFLSEGNITNLLTRSAFIGIIAVGATFVITAGGIDLSVGSMAAVIAGVMIIVMNNCDRHIRRRASPPC
jgi:ribose transport system permease protein